MSVIQKVLCLTQKKLEVVLEVLTLFSLCFDIRILGKYLTDSLLVSKISVKNVQLWFFLLGEAKNFLNKPYIYIYIYIYIYEE